MCIIISVLLRRFQKSSTGEGKIRYYLYYFTLWQGNSPRRLCLQQHKTQCLVRITREFCSKSYHPASNQTIILSSSQILVLPCTSPCTNAMNNHVVRRHLKVVFQYVILQLLCKQVRIELFHEIMYVHNIRPYSQHI